MYLSLPIAAAVFAVTAAAAQDHEHLHPRKGSHQPPSWSNNNGNVVGDYQVNNDNNAAAPTPNILLAQTTGTGVWASTAQSTTIIITTASANARCGAQFGTRTVCATPTASCASVRSNYSTCKPASITKTTSKPPSTTTSSKPPSSTGVTGAPYGAVSDILTAHNNARKTHNANNLVWDSHLTDLAKKWAEACIWKHGGAEGAGQNLAAAAGQSQNGQASVNMWMAEEKDYNPSNPIYSHFTQVVWKSSTKLGCWQAKCPKFVDGDGKDVFPGFTNSLYTVCNYSPAGNVQGQFAQNVDKVI